MYVLGISHKLTVREVPHLTGKFPNLITHVSPKARVSVDSAGSEGRTVQKW